jgi:hypothetical protein
MSTVSPAGPSPAMSAGRFRSSESARTAALVSPGRRSMRLPSENRTAMAPRMLVVAPIPVRVIVAVRQPVRRAATVRR